MREVFDELAELSASERDAALERVFPQELRAEVAGLLASHDAARAMLTTPVVGATLGAAMLAGIGDAAPDDPLIGKSLGKYEIIDMLGAGGMGVVYRARQESPSRIVALKVLRQCAPDASLLRRFEQEAQVLGRLQHTGIAQVYEAGTARGPDGRLLPFFAMELVHGRPLLRYADEVRLDTRARLELMARICDAVHHAHTKGVVHRDLKPGNILVSEVSVSAAQTSTGKSLTRTIAEGPQPKVLDFGIARLLESDIAQTTMRTDIGQVLGTLPYMSPEQVRGDAHLVDTRSDVYTLGVVLYELLTGRLPYDVKGKSVAQAALIITSEEPVSFSHVLGALRGDVETIVRKAMEKEPQRRYSSAADMASDIRRHLADLPITARPATTIYQLRKFASRNRALVAGASAAVLALMLGIVGTSVGLVRARGAQRLAESRERDARDALRTAEDSERFLISMLSAANPQVSRNRDLTVRELLDEAAMRIDTELDRQPAVALRTRLAMSRTYLSIHALDAAEAQVRAARTLASEHFGERSVESSLALAQEGGVLHARQNFIKAAEAKRAALEMRQSVCESGNPLIARAKSDLGLTLMAMSKFSDAEQLLREADRELRASGESEAAFSNTLALSGLLLRVARPEAVEEGRSLLEAARDEAASRGVAGQLQVADALLLLADFDRYIRKPQDAVRRIEEAITLRESAYPKDHPQLLFARLSLARALRMSGRLTDARRVIDALPASVSRVIGPRTTSLAEVYTECSRIESESGDLVAATEAALRAVELLDPDDPPIRRTVAKSMLAQTYEKRGLWEDAASVYAAEFEHGKHVGYRTSVLSTIAGHQAIALMSARQHERARVVLREVIALAKNDPQLSLVRSEMWELLGKCAESEENLPESEHCYRQAIRESAPHDSKWAAEQHELLANVLDRLGKPGDAQASRELAKSMLGQPVAPVGGAH